MHRIGLIGDQSPAVLARQAIPLARQLAQEHTGIALEFAWVDSDSIRTSSNVSEFDGLWCVPASPFRSEAGALRTIQFAREHARPFLGACGGFQHLSLEYARRVLGWANAERGETNPGAERAVITPRACSLVEASDVLRLVKGSRIAGMYQGATSHEGYHCNYGLNPAFTQAIVGGPLPATAFDAAGEVRAVELDAHRFFVGTLFQPERAALTGKLPPLVEAFVRACSLARAGVSPAVATDVVV